MDKDELLDRTIKQLFEVAFKDGVVDDAEFELIQQIEVSVEAFAESLDRALLDNIITPEETRELEELRDKIMADAEHVAKGDGVIDAEETELLKTLSTILKKYQTQ